MNQLTPIQQEKYRYSVFCRVVTVLVFVSRLAILVSGIQWLRADMVAYFWVAAVSFLLTFMPDRLIQDRSLATATRACVALLFSAHIALGIGLGWYETSSIYDKFMHMLGMGAITGLMLLAAVQYSHRQKLILPRSFLLINVFGLAISAGTLWEVFEFVIDGTGLFNAQRGLQDTMLDLIADTIGAFIALNLYIWATRRKSIELNSRSN